MTRRINLVPPSERPRTTTDVGLLLMLVLTIVVVFGLGFGYYLLSGQLADKEQELADLEQQVAEVEAQVAALRQYEVVKIQRDEMEAVVQGIYSARTTVSGILDDISLVVPNTIWFQSLGLTVADPVVADGTRPIHIGPQRRHDAVRRGHHIHLRGRLPVAGPLPARTESQGSGVDVGRRRFGRRHRARAEDVQHEWLRHRHVP